MSQARLFIQRTNHRVLPADFNGHVLLWDIDKTYLDTRFSSLRGLVGIVAEAALDKRANPGAVPLLRALRRGPGPGNALTPLYFVSGSPPQLRPILEKKMTWDGVQYDGITFKDQLGLLRARRPTAIREQVGYKLCALLMYRAEASAAARWWMFGDDVESDADVFSLFGEVCAGLRGDELASRMKSLGAHSHETRAAVELAAPLPVTDDPVEAVFIRLERGTHPSEFTQRHVIPVQTFLQAALVLLGRGRIRPEDVTAVAADLRRQHVPEPAIARELEDAEVRLGIPSEHCALARRA